MKRPIDKDAGSLVRVPWWAADWVLVHELASSAIARMALILVFVFLIEFIYLSFRRKDVGAGSSSRRFFLAGLVVLALTILFKLAYGKMDP